MVHLLIQPFQLGASFDYLCVASPPSATLPSPFWWDLLPSHLNFRSLLLKSHLHLLLQLSHVIILSPFTLWAFYILACIPSFYYLFPIASCLLLQVHLHNDDGFRGLGGIMLLPTSHLGRQAAWGPPRILTPYHKSHTCNHGGWTLHTKYN